MAEKLMHALQYESYGGGAAALKHVQVPVPSPKDNEVLLKLEATSLNPVDWKVQKGMIRPFPPRKFPCIPATDLLARSWRLDQESSISRLVTKLYQFSAILPEADLLNTLLQARN